MPHSLNQLAVNLIAFANAIKVRSLLISKQLKVLEIILDRGLSEPTNPEQTLAALQAARDSLSAMHYQQENLDGVLDQLFGTEGKPEHEHDKQNQQCYHPPQF